MLNKFLKSAVGLCVFAAMLSAAFAQSGQLEGTVKLRGTDGSLKPVAGATVDIWRTDIKGHWEVKTDKSGHFVYLGLPLQGTFLVVASGPGLQWSYVNGVRITQVPSLDIVANPGDGSRPTLEQVQAVIKQPRSGAVQAPQVDKAAAEAARKAQAEYEAKVKEVQALQASFDQARNHYNQGIELRRANNLQAALSEFELAASVDPSKHAAFAELAHKANANLAETHYQMGVDLFNQRKRDEAKKHFEAAVEAITKAINVLSSAPADKAATAPPANNELLVYYDILAKNTKLLVEFYQAADRIPAAVAALDRAEALDTTASKNKWGVIKGDLYRAAGQTDEAIAAYKKVLAVDPNNLDALFGIGLTLLASTDMAKLQESANYLADFVAKAPPSDKRVNDAKATLEALKNQFKVEAEKPSQRRRGKP
jgi:tetratricopeptide (TPR) repeat protein